MAGLFFQFVYKLNGLHQIVWVFFLKKKKKGEN